MSSQGYLILHFFSLFADLVRNNVAVQHLDLWDPAYHHRLDIVLVGQVLINQVTVEKDIPDPRELRESVEFIPGLDFVV